MFVSPRGVDDGEVARLGLVAGHLEGELFGRLPDERPVDAVGVALHLKDFNASGGCLRHFVELRLGVMRLWRTCDGLREDPLALRRQNVFGVFLGNLGLAPRKDFV